MSRTRVQRELSERCTADPGPRLLAREYRGPGSAMQHCVPPRARDTEALLCCGRNNIGRSHVPDDHRACGAERARTRSGRQGARSELRQVPRAARQRRTALAGVQLGRGAGLVRRRAVSVMERHPQQPDHALGRRDRRDQRIPQALELRQRQHPRPPGPAGHRRARPARHPHRVQRPHHGADGSLRWQAALLAERHRGEVRQFDLVHRHERRHRRQLERRGRRAGNAAAGLPDRRQDRQGDDRHRRPDQAAERARVLARREASSTSSRASPARARSTCSTSRGDKLANGKKFDHLRRRRRRRTASASTSTAICGAAGA